MKERSHGKRQQREGTNRRGVMDDAREFHPRPNKWAKVS
jgi:hypothetical protein